jgi:hypothetical protein
MHDGINDNDILLKNSYELWQHQWSKGSQPSWKIEEREARHIRNYDYIKRHISVLSID